MHSFISPLHFLFNLCFSALPRTLRSKTIVCVLLNGPVVSVPCLAGRAECVLRRLPRRLTSLCSCSDYMWSLLFVGEEIVPPPFSSSTRVALSRAQWDSREERGLTRAAAEGFIAWCPDVALSCTPKGHVGFVWHTGAQGSNECLQREGAFRSKSMWSGTVKREEAE